MNLFIMKYVYLNFNTFTLYLLMKQTYINLSPLLGRNGFPMSSSFAFRRASLRILIGSL